MTTDVPGLPVKSLPLAGEVFSVAGRTAFLIAPPRPAPGRAPAWVWYAPTLEGLPGPEEKWMFERLLAAGLAVAGLDVGESYGSPRGCELYAELYAELTGRRGFARQACLLARSRGGLMLYNWAAQHPDAVACAAGIYPVCNLESWPGLKTAAAAYGLAEAQLAADLARYNPLDRVEALARAGAPIFHIHGDQDTVVPLDRNSAELARRYRGFGGRMTLRVIAGQGHNMWPGWFQCRELVEFIIAHAAGR